MTYKLESRFIGYPPIEGLLATVALAPVNIPWPPIAPGLLCQADDPVWGPGEFVFGKYGGSVRQYGLCVNTPTFNTVTRTFDQLMTEAPNTANLGRPVYVAMADVGTVGAVINQFGWFMDTGVVPVNGTASVAAGTTVGVTGAGQIGGNSAGKQILNAVCANPATATVVKAVAGAGNANQLGGNTIQVTNVDGLFVGGYLSGTGVGTNALILSIDRIGMVLTVNVVNSAAVVGNVTQTNNNATIFYNEVAFDRAFMQGAIT